MHYHFLPPSDLSNIFVSHPMFLTRLRQWEIVYPDVQILLSSVNMLQVKVTKRLPGSTDEKFIRFLQAGDFFGERALES